MDRVPLKLYINIKTKIMERGKKKALIEEEKYYIYSFRSCPDVFWRRIFYLSLTNEEFINSNSVCVCVCYMIVQSSDHSLARAITQYW